MKKIFIIAGIVMVLGIAFYFLWPKEMATESCDEATAEVEDVEFSEAIADSAYAAPATEEKVEKHVPLNVTLNNLTSSTAPVVVHVYKSNRNFLHQKGRVKVYKFIPTSKTLNASIDNLKYGEYAIIFYQDINSNGEMDRNMLGLPTEGYAMSNNFKPKVKAPTYDDCKFTYSASNNQVVAELID
jgi:uncharacterized protein (DUF2141 family)